MASKSRMQVGDRARIRLVNVPGMPADLEGWCTVSIVELRDGNLASVSLLGADGEQQVRSIMVDRADLEPE